MLLREMCLFIGIYDTLVTAFAVLCHFFLVSHFSFRMLLLRRHNGIEIAHTIRIDFRTMKSERKKIYFILPQLISIKYRK